MVGALSIMYVSLANEIARHIGSGPISGFYRISRMYALLGWAEGCEGGCFITVFAPGC